MQHSTEISARSGSCQLDRVHRNGIITCIAIVAGIAASYLFLFDLSWKGSAHAHSETEELATVLSLIVGIMAIVRYYSQRNGLLLMIGAAFIGTGILDGYHAIVTSPEFRHVMPSDLPSLIPWSWIASRWYLSVFLFASAIVWRMHLGQMISNLRGEITVFAIATTFTLSSLAFFLYYPLPQGYFTNTVIHRPEEFLPAIFFMFALIAFTWERNWTRNATEYWLVMSLVVGLCTQTIYMPFSSSIFDLEFEVAHFLKIASYALVFIGLMKSMYSSFEQVIEGEAKLKQQALLLKTVLENVEEGISYYDSDLNLKMFNSHYLEMQGIPKGKIVVGDNLEDICRYRAEHGEYGDCDVEQVVRQKLSIAKNFEPHSYEHIRPNGQVIMIAGNPIGGNSMVASYRDVTNRVKQEQQLRDSEQTLQTRVGELEELKRALEDKTEIALQMAEDLRLAQNVQHDAIQNISEGFVLWDADDKLVMCNDVFRRLYAELEDVFEQDTNFQNFITKVYERGVLVMRGDQDLASAVAERIKLHHQSVVAFDEQMSAERWVRVSERRTSDDGIVSIITDITDRKNWESKMKHLAETDALTGLPNRVII